MLAGQEASLKIGPPTVTAMCVCVVGGGVIGGVPDLTSIFGLMETDFFLGDQDQIVYAHHPQRGPYFQSVQGPVWKIWNCFLKEGGSGVGVPA